MNNITFNPSICVIAIIEMCNVSENVLSINDNSLVCTTPKKTMENICSD